MIAGEPRVRRRGFFLHSSDSGEPDSGELENPEGFVVRARASRPSRPYLQRQVTATGRSGSAARVENSDPQIRSGSVTGSRQRSR